MEDKRAPRPREDKNGTDGTDRTYEPPLIPAHGGYRKLKSYQTAEIIFDATVAFCDRFIDRRSRTHDQMVQAARSGKQNIAEASQVSATSKKTELKLTGVARASLEELLQDYQDFLRRHRLPIWPQDHPQTQAIRRIAYKCDRSYESDRPYPGAPGRWLTERPMPKDSPGVGCHVCARADMHKPQEDVDVPRDSPPVAIVARFLHFGV